jgi:S-adenosylmethionine uptake transporter
MSSQSHLIGSFFGLLAFGLFSVSDVSLKWLGAGLNPLQVLFFSCLFALPLIVAYARLSDPRQPLRPRHPRLTLFRALLAVFNSVAVIYAFGALPLAQAYAIFFTMPLFIALMAVPILGERLDALTAGAIVLGLVGVFVALQPGRMPLEWAHLAALAGAMSGALNSALIRRTRDESYLVLVLYPMGAQLLAAGLALPFVFSPMTRIDLAVTGLQALCGVSGMVAFIAAYRRATAAFVAPMQYSQIIWATLLGLVIFGERPSLATGAGIALIVAAGMVVLLRKPDTAVPGKPPVRPPAKPPAGPLA